mgnify:CR=1 FL=1
MATTTVAASSGGANAKGKLVGKDYITLAIFGVLLSPCSWCSRWCWA